MHEKLIKQAIDLFDTPEKWEAFGELYRSYNAIKMRGFREMRDELYREELALQDPNWNVVKWNDWDIRWELATEGKRLWIHFWGDYLKIYVGNLDISKVQNLIMSNERFNRIRQVFNEHCRLDGFDNNTLAFERQSNIEYTFNNKTVIIKDSDELSWYVAHYPTEFKLQLLKKVRALQTPEMVELFKEIVEKCQ